MMKYSFLGQHFKIGFAFCLIITLFISSCGKKKETAKPQRKSITQAIYASGKIYPLEYYRVVPSISGYIETIFVQVGDSVSSGDALFSIKNNASDLAINSADNTLALARENAAKNSALLNTYLQDVNAAKTKFSIDSNSFARYQGLVKEGGGTALEFDKLKAAKDASFEQLKKAKAAYSAAKQKADTDLKNALNTLALAKSNAGDKVIRASLSGKVFDIIGKRGEYASPQTVVMEIGKMGEYEVELNIDESDLNFVQSGQKVAYTGDAFGANVYTGTIKTIYPKVNPLNKAIKATATILLPSEYKIFAGATVEANIEYKQVKDALVIPKIYLRNDSVIVKDGLGKKSIKIKKGIEDVEFVQVLEGLSENDELLKP